MSKIILNITVENILSLLCSGNVVNYEKKTLIDNKPYNEFQVVCFKDTIFTIFYFDAYGIKNKSKTKELSNEDIVEFLERYINYDKSNRVFTYHKQRISKKVIKPTLNNEFDSKKLVYDWLNLKYPNATIVPEFSVGKRRADYICFANNQIVLIEIKSELDSLNRLEEQLKQYELIGHFVYIAMHINKYNLLIKKQIQISKNIGILVIENNQLSLKKDAICNVINYNSLHSFISYSEHLSSVKGLKLSSKFSKEQIKVFVEENIEPDILYSYYYEVLKMRYEYENKIRKQYFMEQQFEKALGSASLIGINRFNISTSNNYYLIDHIPNIDKDILKKMFLSRQNEFIKVFGSLECYKKLMNWENIKIMRHDLEIMFYNVNEYDNYKSLIENFDIIYENRVALGI